MDVLKAQLARMQQQLLQLSASQKMLAMSLVAIMVLTLLFWGRYASTADMEAVLDQTLKPDEVTRITSQIRSRGIEYQLVGDRIMVPADRKFDVLSELSYLQLLPNDTSNTYDEILKRVNPWSSTADNDATRNQAKSVLLSQLIKKFPGVWSADVLIDPTNERRLGGGGKQPVATILIILEDRTKTRFDRNLVNAAAQAVVGAQSGLALSNIKVVINGVPCTVSDRNSGVGGFASSDEILSQQQEAEQFFTQKISQLLIWIPGAMVAVTCDVNIKSERRTEELYDPKGIASKESSSESETNEQASPPAPGGEPGAIPNAPLSVGGSSPSGSGAAAGSNRNRESTKFENHFSKSQIESSTPPGKPKALAATVRLPRSFFVGVYKRSNPDSKSEPDEQAVAQLVEKELPKIRRDVKSCTYITNDEDIVVDTYPDDLPLLSAVATSSLAASKSAGGFAAALGGHYKEIGIGVLALISLFMVSSIVKKGTPAPVMAVVSAPTQPEMLMAGEDVAGEAMEGSSTLDGMELDDDAVKAQQMVEQVATMVKENPDGAANLVKRWLNRT
ncbi:MAG: hypothetical protein H7Z14_19505 [Anaerolineae bacterium]|nr:hypothetical protein [Phycisphaerae bacterium]